jgi:hypothetical protein
MMELVRIDSSHFPSVYPDGFTDRIFTDARVVELPLYHESYHTATPYRTVGSRYALPLKVRERIYRHYQLTIFAKESMRVDQMFMAGDVRIYFRGEVSHHALVLDIGAPEQIEGSAFLKYLIRYIDVNPAAYFCEPVSDFLTREALLARYRVADLYNVRLHSEVFFDDPEFGGQHVTLSLTPQTAQFIGYPTYRWQFSFFSYQASQQLSKGDSVRIALSGTVTLPGRSGHVTSAGTNTVTVLTDITIGHLSEHLIAGTTATMGWNVDADFYTAVCPEQGYSDVEEVATALGGIQKPSTVFGQKGWQVTLFVDSKDYIMLKKYLQVLTGDNGSVTLIMPEGHSYSSIERIRPEEQALDAGLYKLTFFLKYKAEVFHIYNF